MALERQMVLLRQTVSKKWSSREIKMVFGQEELSR